jgi:uncharacterized lipoprotein YmbA
MKYLIISTAVMLSITGCSTKSNFYQLHSHDTADMKRTAPLQSRVIGVDHVDLADYLDKPQIRCCYDSKKM